MTGLNRHFEVDTLNEEMPYEYEQDQDIEACLQVLMIVSIGATLILGTSIVISWIVSLLGG